MRGGVLQVDRTCWRAKTIYLFLAIALAAGLVLPGLALGSVAVDAGHGTIAIDAPSYTKVGQTVVLKGISDPKADWYYWDMGDGTKFKDGELTKHVYKNPGIYAITVVAHWGTIEQDATHQIMIGEGLIPQEAWNVLNADETFTVPDGYRGRVVSWDFNPGLGLTGTGMDYVQRIAPDNNSVTVGGVMDIGELQIVAYTNLDLNGDGHHDVLYGAKKWGKIDHTNISEPGATQTIWYENYKTWYGAAEITEEVIGQFHADCPDILHPADGAEVYWWLVDGRADVTAVNRCDSKESLIADINALPPASHVTFADSGTTTTTTVSGSPYLELDEDGKVIKTISDAFASDGLTGVVLEASGEEAVKVICLATYPNLDGIQFPVCPEFTSWNFWSLELEKVPQVRWAGEKIILEKQFGPSYAGCPVMFYLENQSVGTLESIGVWIDMFDAFPPFVSVASNDTAFAIVDETGVARTLLTSESPGEVDVTCALYAPVYDSNPNPEIQDPFECVTGVKLINQHGFVVFFLKMEELSLGNVAGQRVDNPLTEEIEGHDSGLWYPENPLDPTSDMACETLNVSQDTLLRARVKGWFMGDDLSWRPQSFVDLNHNEIQDPGEITLPAGRWVLPDDWEYLAGPLWEELRPHWDIMDQPDDAIMSIPDTNADKAEELGEYVTWETDIVGNDTPSDIVAEDPVIGPYDPLDVDPMSHLYTPEVNPVVSRKTMVPNEQLNWWDCPMPPAKIIFDILDDSPGDDARGQGYFKEVDKGDVYYNLVDLTQDIPGPDGIAYTSPFYETMIPANPLIPPFVNNGGYDWNSWDPSYGPYQMWDFINRPRMEDDPLHPTKVEVYSDNHGEAMVYLNGDWNYDPSEWPTNQWMQPEWVLPNGAWDIPYGCVVGSTSVMAIADYPYLRKHPATTSNTVCKNWSWGQEKLVDVEQQIQPQLAPENGRKLVTVWVSDRDGFADVGMQVDWRVQAPSAIEAFLGNTNGVITNPEATTATSFTRPVFDDPDPDVYDDVKRFADAFPEKFPLGISKQDRYDLAKAVASHYAVAGVYVTCSEPWVRSADIMLYRPQPEPDGSEGIYMITHSVVDTSGTTMSGLDFGWASRVDPEEDLSQGWNLVTYFGATASVEASLSTVIGNVEAVWAYDNQTQQWLCWSPDVPDWVNSLTAMKANTPYYIKVSEDCVWCY